MMKKNNIANISLITLSTILCLFLVSLSAYFLGFDNYTVIGSSMHPTIIGEEKEGKIIKQRGDKIYIRKTKKLNRGDICVFSNPESPNEKYLIKRVIGVEGDSIEVKDGAVFLNDKKLDEPYLSKTVITTPDPRNSETSFKVGKGEFFCLGDNRGHSHDSRYLGCINKKQILGKCISVYRNKKLIKVW